MSYEETLAQYGWSFLKKEFCGACSGYKFFYTCDAKPDKMIEVKPNKNTFAVRVNGRKTITAFISKIEDTLKKI